MTGPVAPVGYAGLLAVVKVQVRTARLRSLRVVNTELLRLYWAIGHVDRQAAEGWGTRVIDRLADDLRAGHITVLLDKLDDPADRTFYAGAAVQHGWSRKVLLNQIIAPAAPAGRGGTVELRPPPARTGLRARPAAHQGPLRLRLPRPSPHRSARRTWRRP